MVADSSIGASSTGASSDAAIDAFTASLPEVYGYLFARCGDRWLAEDLTSETFAAAVSALERGLVAEVTNGWLIVVARRRLIDHWRRATRIDPASSDRSMLTEPEVGPDWTEPMDVVRCRCALARLGGHHQAVLTLRYVDGLSVDEVAREIGRGYEATEALLYRARNALRRAYDEEVGDHG
jgi:RNA polymerase sigma-70 factor, ECF subfamily